MPASLSGHPFNILGILDNSWHFARNDLYLFSPRILTYSYSTNSSSTFRSIFDGAIAELESFLAIDFQRRSDEAQINDNFSNFQLQPGADTSADLRFSQQTSAGAGGTAVYHHWETTGDTDSDDIDAGAIIWSVNHYTILHELGHTLSLKHTSPDQSPEQSPFIEAQFRTNNYTVMHYKMDEDANGNPVNITNAADGEWDYRHFQLLDVYALQLRFGANMSTWAGNTNHTASSLAVTEWLKVLWDASGTDTIDMSAQSRTQIIDLGEGRFSNIGAVAGNNPDGWNLAVAYNAKIENATGGSGNDTIKDNGLNNILQGGGGDDLILATKGGADTVYAGAGNDGVVVGAVLTATDYLDGGDGDKDQLGLQGNYAGLVLGANSLINFETLALLTGADTRFGDSGTNFYSYNITTVDANVAAGDLLTVNFNTLRVGENVTFNGSAETNGGFFCYGGLGVDILTGGSGTDAFFFGNNGAFTVSDQVNGGGGASDQLGLRGNYATQLVFNAGTMQNIDTLALLSATDTRFASGGTLFSYNVKSHDGNVAAGQMLAVNANGLQVGEILTFDGSAETNGYFRLVGGKGGDLLTGGAGADSLYGLSGADTLRGNGGNDSYVFRAGESTAAATDRIDGFHAGDKIDLASIDADTSSAATNEAFTYVGASAFSGVAGQLRAAVQGDGSWRVEGDVNGDAIADLVISVGTLSGYALGSSDFML